MKTTKIELKECKKFGNTGSHIVMAKNDAGNKFLVLPENSRWVLKDILNKYNEEMKEIINPKLCDVLSKEDYKKLKELYEKEIKAFKGGYMSSIRNRMMKDTLSELKKKEFRVSDVEDIFNQTESTLPKDLRKKLLILLNKN